MTPGSIGNDYRHLSTGEKLRGLANGVGVSGDGRGWGEAGRVGPVHRLRYGLLLQVDVVGDVDRPLGLRHADAVCAQQRLREGVDAGGLVVPLDEVAHQVALDERGMDPVDIVTA